MRDIRPAASLPSGPSGLPTGQAGLPPKKSSFNVPQKPLPPARQILSGSSVPVSSVHVPRQISASRTISPPITPKQEVTPERPLFVAKPMKTKTTPMRVGHKERKIVAGLVALVIIALLLAGFIFLPTANVKLVLHTAPLLIDQKLTITGNQAQGDNIIPGSAFFREIMVEDTAPVSSKEIVGAKARGNVQIVNRSTDEQKIKEHSRLVTADGLLFYMQGSAILPPASGGTLTRVTVGIEAAEDGDKGNINPQHLDFAALDETSQKLVYAEAAAKLTGGKGEEVTVIKDEDMENAKKVAGQVARDKAEQEIRAELPKGWLILDESWTANIESFETEVKVADKQETIPYKARITVHVLGYEGAKLEEKLRAELTSHLEKEFMLFPGPISYTKSVDNIDWDKGAGDLAVRVTHTTIPNLKLDTLRQKIAGRKQDEAKNYLQGLPGVGSVDINLWPFWVKSIPYIEKRITLDLTPERQP